MKKTLAYVAVLIFSVSLIVLFIEGLGRIMIHVRYGVSGKSYGLWQYDPELGATYRPNSYNTLTSLNNYGFRNEEDVFDPRPPNSLRVIAFGGSTTFGYNLRDGETFTERLEQKLKTIPGYERTQVLNAGQVSYSTGHTWIRVKRLVPQLEPDYVILYEGLNEMLNAWVLNLDGISFDQLYETETYGVLGRRYGQNNWLSRNSIIARFLTYVVQRAINGIREKEVVNKNYQGHALEAQAREIRKVIDHPWLVENYRFLLGQAIDFLLSQGVTPIVVRYAFVPSSEVEIFSDVSAEVAREKGVPICDMRSRFEQAGDRIGDLFIHTGVHVTPQGAEILAEELFQTISKDLGRKGVGS